MFMWAMSDRAIPRSYRMMQGFGVNTFVLVNKAGKRHFVKFHWIPHLGVHSLVWDEALKLGGQDPDFHGQRPNGGYFQQGVPQNGTLPSSLFPRRTRMTSTLIFWMPPRSGQRTLFLSV